MVTVIMGNDELEELINSGVEFEISHQCTTAGRKVYTVLVNREWLNWNYDLIIKKPKVEFEEYKTFNYVSKKDK